MPLEGKANSDRGDPKFFKTPNTKKCSKLMSEQKQNNRNREKVFDLDVQLFPCPV